MRNMTILLEDVKYADFDIKSLVFVHCGGRGAENMITEYIGKVDKFMRQKGISIKEEIFRSPEASNKSIVDYNMIEKGADYAVVFTTDDDKRSHRCIKLLEEFNIPMKIIRH